MIIFYAQEDKDMKKNLKPKLNQPSLDFTK